ncbi:hypothetical protein Hanom_Chr16g01464891 [Helianthus anomalus]
MLRSLKRSCVCGFSGLSSGPTSSIPVFKRPVIPMRPVIKTRNCRNVIL